MDVDVVLIAAMDEARLIGAGNAMPWHLPADLAHFKALTLGRTLLMGRRTVESIGKLLPGRTTLMLSTTTKPSLPGCERVGSLDAALAHCATRGETELVVAGGAMVYELAMPRAVRMHLTRIGATFSGDTWFPQWRDDEWQLAASEARAPDGRNAHPLVFETWTRR